jgi:hypothetical protein
VEQTVKANIKIIIVLDSIVFGEVIFVIIFILFLISQSNIINYYSGGNLLFIRIFVFFIAAD